MKLALLEHNQQRRLQPRDLTAQLRADGTATAAYEYRAAAVPRGDGPPGELHRLAAEEVVNLHVAYIPHANATAHQIGKRWQRAKRQTRLFARLDDLSSYARTCSRHGDDDEVRRILRRDAWQLGATSRDDNPVDLLADLPP